MNDDEMRDREPNEAHAEAEGSPSDAAPAPADEATQPAESTQPAEAFDFGDAPEPPAMQPPLDLDADSDVEAPPEPEALPEPWPPPQADAPAPEPAEPPETSQPVAPESMTDQESGRAEAEASAEAAIDDGRGTVLPGDDDRDPTLDLAALHLRLGSLALARSELETFAGRGVLDASARIDLAEVRWRTGDLVGGGEAAREALAGGGEAVVALVVAAEAASALGRPTEARRLAGRAMSLHGGPIDGIFAGMPRSSVWPADPAEPVPSPSTLFPPERSDLAIESERDEAALAVTDDGEAGAAADAVVAPTERVEPGLWDLHEAAAIAAAAAQPVPSDLDPSALFDAGRAALENGDRPSAAVHLGLVVRMAPALAPAVLSLIGEPSDSGLQLVQGDAYRAVGHEAEARRSYAAAIASASTPSTPSTVEWFGPPSTAEPGAAAWWLESLDESRPAAAWPPPAPAAPPAEPPGPEPESAAPEPEGPTAELAEHEPEASNAELADPLETEPEPESAEPEEPEPEAMTADLAEPEATAEPEPEPEATTAEPAEPEPTTAEPAGPEASTPEPTEPQAPEAFEPTTPDPEPEWRDDEGGRHDEDEEWRFDG